MIDIDRSLLIRDMLEPSPWILSRRIVCSASDAGGGREPRIKECWEALWDVVGSSGFDKHGDHGDSADGV